MEQETLRIAVAAIVVALMLWMIGFGVMLRRRGVNPNAVAEHNTNWMQRGLIAGAGLLDIYLVFRAPFPVLDAWVAAQPSPSPYIALALLLIGATIILLSQSGMGRSWRVGVPSEENHVDALVTGGLHGLSRNPVYLGVMVFLVGALIAAPGPLPLLAIVVSYLGLTIIIKQEEGYLREHFGEEYDAYAKRVRRWV
ncbi:methyltransferase family protein [Hyphococcus sp.]|uniref:methyltransferase family protein n=1 Tax=Hyphococcus sp. TaxID=2038636 RepID=UPI0020876FF4|nr:MAG: hypothetical protein DHS20C04_18720 [Marinicaulis sp.]